ncbi:MAG TPA: hypothetical protein VGL94_17695 [Ktedonobacteraceae bacterium]
MATESGSNHILLQITQQPRQSFLILVVFLPMSEVSNVAGTLNTRSPGCIALFNGIIQSDWENESLPCRFGTWQGWMIRLTI